MESSCHFSYDSDNLKELNVLDSEKGDVLKDIDVYDTPGSRKVVSFNELDDVLKNCDVSSWCSLFVGTKPFPCTHPSAWLFMSHCRVSCWCSTCASMSHF